jgi:hypothetical protein
MRSLPIKVVLHDIESLPNGTYGALGTLAFKHRLIFQEERENYDIYVSQEDDIAIEPHHLSYFLKWSSFFEGTNLYPGFQWFEFTPWENGNDNSPRDTMSLVSSSQVTVRRLSHLWLYRIKNVDFISPGSINCCMYMLTKAMLFYETSRADWLQSLHSVKGEFNAYYGTTRWLSARYRTAIPVSELHTAITHHLPNKYVGSDQVTFSEVIHALSKCMNLTTMHQNRVGMLDVDMIESSDLNTPTCAQCLGQGSAVYQVMTKTTSGLHVHFSCQRTSDISWPEYEGKDRLVV